MNHFGDTQSLEDESMTTAIGFVVAILIFNTGCAFRGDESSTVKVVGGSEISRSEAPWTLKITFPNESNNFCTATFVSHNTMLTAAHCASDHPVITLPELSGVTSVKVYQYPSRFPSLGTIDDANDVAVVVFPDNTAPAYIQLATHEPTKGDAVTLVGYGSCTQFLGPRETMGRCRGTNEIDEIDAETMIVTRGSTGVVLSKGDSGGPLFAAGNKIIGVANAGTGVVSKHSNLLAPKNFAWLKTVVKDGKAVICGLEGQQCQNPTSGSSASGVASSAVAKAETLAKQLIEKLASESLDCKFKLNGSVMLIENDTRFVARIAYGATTSYGKSIGLDLPLTGQTSGEELFEKLKDADKLEVAFEDCTF